MKAGTHSPLLKGSHTTAHTAKQRPSLPRPQRGLVLPAISLLFHHAFIYIHFPVLCGPPLYQQREKLRQSCCHKFYPQPFLIAFLGFSHKWPTFAFTPEIEYTLGFAQRIAHSGPHAETRAFQMGHYYYPRTVPHVHEHPRAGCQNGKLCRFWGLVGGCPQRTQRAFGTAMRLCASLSRGVAAPLGCVICLQLGDVAVFSLCAQYFLIVRGGGGITTLSALCVLLKRRTAACQNGSFAVF